jgi:hypothetical protein
MRGAGNRVIAAQEGFEPDRVDEAKQIDADYRERSGERERQFRAAITSGATYLALMATAAIQGVKQAADVTGRASTIRTAQFFLTILAVLVLRYMISSIRGISEAIVDDAARRHELEALDKRIRPVDMRLAAHNAALRRSSPVLRHLARRLLALLPRGGKSQRQALVLGGLVAALPAAWFSLAPDRTTALDVAVVMASSLCFLAWVRLVFVGAKHWIWVDPRCGNLVRRPYKENPPRWWWRHRLSSEKEIAVALKKSGPPCTSVGSDDWPDDCRQLYGPPAQIKPAAPR